MHQRKILAAVSLALLFVCHPALAAKLYISEYGSVGTAVYATGGSGGVLQIAKEPALPQTPVNFTSTATSSAPFGANTHFILILCDTQCSWRVGTSPTATTSDMLLPALTYWVTGVDAGQTISVISNP